MRRAFPSTARGTLALVSNLVDGTVSVFTIQDKTVTSAGTVEVGGPKAGGNAAGKLVMVRVVGKTLSRVAEAPIGRWSQGAAFSPDGKTILVGNMIEKDYWVLQWDGTSLRDTGQRVKMNGGPAAIRTAEK